MRLAHKVAPGDIVTMPHGIAVRIIEVLTLPDRRGPQVEAESHYREHHADNPGTCQDESVSQKPGNA